MIITSLKILIPASTFFRILVYYRPFGVILYCCKRTNPPHKIICKDYSGETCDTSVEGMTGIKGMLIFVKTKRRPTVTDR